MKEQERRRLWGKQRLSPTITCNRPMFWTNNQTKGRLQANNQYPDTNRLTDSYILDKRRWNPPNRKKIRGPDQITKLTKFPLQEKTSHAKTNPSNEFSIPLAKHRHPTRHTSQQKKNSKMADHPEEILTNPSSINKTDWRGLKQTTQALQDIANQQYNKFPTRTRPTKIKKLTHNY